MKPVERIFCACTAGNPPFEELVTLVARYGFDGLSLWQPYLEQQIQGGLTLSELRRLAEEAGVAVQQVEAAAAWSAADSNPQQRRQEVETLLELASGLGARQVLAVNMAAPAGFDDLCEGLTELRDQCRMRDVNVALEFLPWSGIPDLAAASALIREVPGVGLMIDSWHCQRAGVTAAELAALGADQIAGIQWSDCTRWLDGAPSFAETLSERCLPGQGVAPLNAMAAALASTGTRAPQAVELIQLDEAARADYWVAASAQALESLIAHWQYAPSG